MGNQHMENTYHDCAVGNCWDGHFRDTIHCSIAPFTGGVCGYVPKSLVDQGVFSIGHMEWWPSYLHEEHALQEA